MTEIKNSIVNAVTGAPAPTSYDPYAHLLALAGILDDVGAQRREHAPDGKVGRELGIGERIRALAADRDRAVDAERLTREAHKTLTREASELRSRIDAMTRLAAGPIDTEGQPG